MNKKCFRLLVTEFCIAQLFYIVLSYTFIFHHPPSGVLDGDAVTADAAVGRQQLGCSLEDCGDGSLGRRPDHGPVDGQCGRREEGRDPGENYGRRLSMY